MAITLTPSKTSYRIGAGNPPTITASGHTGDVEWVTTRGTLTVDGLTATLVLEDLESFYDDSAIVITATDDVGSASVSINAYATFPYSTDWGFEGTVNSDLEISQSEDNSESTRILSDPFASWPLTFADRELTEYKDALRFYDLHRRSNKWFYYMDAALEEMIFCRFDSEFKRSPRTVDGVGYTFALYTNIYDREAARDAYLIYLLEQGQVEYSPDVIPGFLTFLDADNLELAQGAGVATWPDSSGNERDGVQPNAALRLTYNASESGFSTTETDKPFVLAVEGTPTKHVTVPIPATDTKTIFIVAKRQVASAGWRLIEFDSNNYIYATGNRWAAYKVSGAAGTTPKGYVTEWAVLCWRQNSATSVSFFVDGVLAQTFTPQTNPGVFTSFKIGPGAAYVRQVGVLDRALTDSEVTEHTAWIRRDQGMTWLHDFIDVTGGLAPTLSSHALIIRKEGVTGDRPLVMLNHTYLNTERVFLDNVDFQALLSALLEEGYIVAISRMYAAGAGNENSWGNEQALDALVELYEYTVDNYNVDTDKVAMIGCSMGGVATALSVASKQIPIQGAVFYDAVLNLGAAHASFFTATIDTAYPGSGTYAERTAGHDPMLLDADGWADRRLLFYKNTGDVTVPPASHTDAFDAHISGVTAESDVVSLPGTHLTNIPGTISNTIEFLESCFASPQVIVPPVVPTDLAGLKVWLKADALALADGAAVSSWTDSSGQNNHAVQATGSAQPIFKNPILNGKPVVRFVAGDYLKTAAFAVSLTQPSTIFIVAKQNTNVTGYLLDGLLSTNRHALLNDSGGSGGCIFAGALHADNRITPGSFQIISVEFNGASSNLSFNGVIGANGNAGTNTLTGLTVGARYVGDQNLVGDIAEILVYNVILSSTDRARVTAYLNSKYAVY